jgi:hypothetical protein
LKSVLGRGLAATVGQKRLSGREPIIVFKRKLLQKMGSLFFMALVLVGCSGTTGSINARSTPTAATTNIPETDTPIPLTATPIPRKIAKFFVDGEPFEFIGAFIPGWYWGGENRTNDQTDVQLMESLKQAGITVLHLMPPYLLGAKFGSYNESGFRKLDFFLDQASKQNIRVIIPFVHGLAMTQPGHEPLYSPFGIEKLIQDQDFKNGFVSYMHAVVNRVNSINGRKYSEDPTILGWEIIEEPISGSHNYPQRPPNVTEYEVRQWLDEMARDLKAADPNHLVGVQYAASIEGLPELEDKSLSMLETPSMDFIEIEDGDVRVLQTERSNRLYDLTFETGKPVIMFISFTGLSYPDPGESVPNEERLMKVCDDYLWQADTLSSEFSAYHQKGAAGYFFFSWRVPGKQLNPIDKCFSYSLDTPLVVQAFQQMDAYLGPLNSPGSGFTEVRLVDAP